MSDTPVVVSFPSGVTPTSVAGGYESAYATGSDGKLYAWGDDFYGELGDGGTTNSATPVVVSLPAGVSAKAIAGGGGAAYAGATSDSLTIADTTVGQSGDEYEAVFTNRVGSATTSPATLTVTAPVAPVVTLQPTDDTVVPGQIAGFTASASGVPNPTVLWQYSTDGGTTWLDIAGNATSSTTALSGYVYGTYENGWEVHAVFTNVGGSATTDPATLTVIEPVAPLVTTQPVGDTAAPGQTGSFTAVASGDPTPSVRWQYSTDGGTTWSNIAGNPTSTSITLRGVVYGAFENGWEVRAVFTNAAGSATSDPAILTVS